MYTKMFPEREANFDYLPKTLIFAVSELHAQLIVDVAKEVFGRTDDKFVQKITYSVGNSNDLIKSFRNDVDFRIAVTVTLVATGTDVRPLEVLIFFNDVHSETLYQQFLTHNFNQLPPMRKAKNYSLSLTQWGLPKAKNMFPHQVMMKTS